jgi:hypothetical protein
MVSVPKTPMDEDDFFTPRENKVGTSRQFAVVKSVPIPLCVQQTANEKLWRGVLAFHRSHRLASDSRRFHF